MSQFQSAAHVLVYLGFGSEPKLETLFQDKTTAAMKPRAYYTTRTHHEPNLLTVHELQPENLETHRLGYLQPNSDQQEVHPVTLDMVLVPGLAFDPTGSRLGYGMGFYDRLLSQVSATAVKIGVTYTELVFPELPQEEHDIRMDLLVTESGVVNCAKDSD